MKESYREELASRSGLEPYAGDGDVAGVAPACLPAGRQVGERKRQFAMDAFAAVKQELGLSE